MGARECASGVTTVIAASCEGRMLVTARAGQRRARWTAVRRDDRWQPPRSTVVCDGRDVSLPFAPNRLYTLPTRLAQLALLGD